MMLQKQSLDNYKNQWDLDLAILQDILNQIHVESLEIDSIILKDLKIFLKNKYDIVGVKVCQYLMAIFDIDLKTSSMLYQMYIPKEGDVQNYFK